MSEMTGKEKECPLCHRPSKWAMICDECQEKQSSKVNTHLILIPEPKYEELDEIYSGDTLTDDRARGLFEWEGDLYVNHGAGYYDGEWRGLSCGRVIPVEQHDGPVYSYGELDFKNGSGGFFHGNNQLVKYRGKEYVQIPYEQYIFRIGMRQESLF